jgi:hypothetical protein
MDHFTQSAYILLKYAPTPDEINTILNTQEFSVTKHEHGTDLLTVATASVVFEVAFQAEKSASVLIDIMRGPWPDTISREDPVLFVSWHAGAFGRFAYPGCLERALQECRIWPEANRVVKQHTALLRLRVASKHEPDAREMPGKGIGFEELLFLTRLLLAFDRLSGVLGYFFPGGEALCSRETLSATWQYYTNNNRKPFDLWLMWINRRLVRTNEEPDWAIIDIVGLHQIGVTDLEACFQHIRYRPDQVATWLLNVASYLFENGPIIQDGNTLTGPGGINWKAHSYESSLQFPPRSVLCLRPLDNATLPRRFIKRITVPSPNKANE